MQATSSEESGDGLSDSDEDLDADDAKAEVRRLIAQLDECGMVIQAYVMKMPDHRYTIGLQKRCEWFCIRAAEASSKAHALKDMDRYIADTLQELREQVETLSPIYRELADQGKRITEDPGSASSIKTPSPSPKRRTPTPKRSRRSPSPHDPGASSSRPPSPKRGRRARAVRTRRSPSPNDPDASSSRPPSPKRGRTRAVRKRPAARE